MGLGLHKHLRCFAGPLGFTDVAFLTEQLKPIFRKPALPEPGIQCRAAADCFAMFRTIIENMVNG